MASPLLKEIQALKSQVGIGSSMTNTPIGFVNPDGSLERTLIQIGDEFIETDITPKAYFPIKLEPMFTRPKRFIILKGGRGSGKSIGVGDYVSIDMHDNGNNWLCLREYQNSIADSVHSLLTEEYKRIELEGFSSTEKSIRCDNGSEASFAGLARNPESVKSAFGFKGFWVEEAQSTSEKSLKILTPTGRNKPKKGLPMSMEEIDDNEVDLSQVTMVFVVNPASSEDPFSKRFLAPFDAELRANGIYEDDIHLIIDINWRDNPWYHMSGLEGERKWDYENLDRALYDHIWEGDFNDSIENALILSEWFDACIDAHKKIGTESQWAKGAKFAAHDPSDTGPDSKGYAMRHGSVIYSAEEMTDGGINDGGDWAHGLAIQQGVNHYTWDCDGMGVGLARQATESFSGLNISTTMYKGSESPDNPEAIYQPTGETKDNKTNKDCFKNKRAQYYQALRDRMFNTYLSVVKGEVYPMDKMISFSSGIKSLPKLRAELCRMPVKPNANGLIELYTKDQMKSKFKMASPNLADSVMMLMRNNVRINNNQAIMPPKIKSYRMR